MARRITGAKIRGQYRKAALLAARGAPLTLKVALLSGRSGWGWSLRAEKLRRRVPKQGRGGTSFIQARSE